MFRWLNLWFFAELLPYHMLKKTQKNRSLSETLKMHRDFLANHGVFFTLTGLLYPILLTLSMIFFAFLIFSNESGRIPSTRIRIVFQSSDVNLGRVEGEVEQKIKRTITSQPVRAVPVTENGGVFTGWSCNVEGLSSASEDSVTFTVPKVDENVTEIVITANFAKVGLGIKADGNLTKSIKLDKGQSKQLTADITAAFRGDRTVTWTSEDSSIAKVDENGNVTAVNGGKTQIIASILGNKIYTVCDSCKSAIGRYFNFW